MRHDHRFIGLPASSDLSRIGRAGSRRNMAQCAARRALEKCRGRVAVGHHADLRLRRSDRVAQREADPAFAVVDRIAQGRRGAPAARSGRRARSVDRSARRPRPRVALASDRPEFADAENVTVREVVGLDHFEVRRHEKCGPGGPGREIEHRRARSGSGAPPGRHDAARRPFREGAVIVGEVETAREADLEAPRSAPAASLAKPGNWRSMRGCRGYRSRCPGGHRDPHRPHRS